MLRQDLKKDLTDALKGESIEIDARLIAQVDGAPACVISFLVSLIVAIYLCNVCLTDVVLCFELFVARLGSLRAKRRAERRERHGVFCLL